MLITASLSIKGNKKLNGYSIVFPSIGGMSIFVRTLKYK